MRGGPPPPPPREPSVRGPGHAGLPEAPPAPGPASWQVHLLLLLRCLRVATPAQPLLVSWYRSLGTSISSVFWLTSLYSALVVAAEVPSGRISDCAGRRLTLAAAFATLALSYACCAAAGAAWELLLAAQLLRALGCALFSGTDSALLYETLRQQGRGQRAALVHESRQIFCVSAAEAAASVLGGCAAARYGVQTTIAASSAPFAVCAALCLLLVDVGERRGQQGQGGEPRLWGQCWGSGVRATCTRRPLLDVFLAGVAVNTFTFLAVWLNQLLWERGGVDPAARGGLYAALNAAAALSALAAPAFQSWAGTPEAALTLLLALCAAAYGLMGAAESLPAALCGSAVLSRGLAWPVIGTAINAALQGRDDLRVTVLSLFSAAARLAAVAVGPAVGYAADGLGLPAACWLLAAAAACALGASALYAAHPKRGAG
eukprot:TRINITY_DN2220_c1_g2_i2.p2 TRINITY_DN2220_c1_g2~~TRINITY_DN2220_c1_g2_i2.p2  ORF type:complete len:432 (+),score=124.66 TRINITY_DN2220_c1_g2_i2:62-1357(+)